MIRINLLPVRAAKKKETAQQQMIVAVASVIACLLVMVLLYFLLLAKISSTKDEISRSEQELEQLKSKIGQINDLKKLQEDVKKKLDVLTRLRNEKTGPVERLATLSESTPDKLWITKYSENNADVSLAGVAYNEELIASFMRNLQSSNRYSNVELVVSEQVDVGGVKAKRFELTCKIVSLSNVTAQPVVNK